MNFWLGKAVGGVLGLLSGGPFGLLIGAFTGHLLDQTAVKFIALNNLDSPLASNSQQGVQQVFFQATFRTMGRLAKADGRVSEAEIAAANHIMDQMGLSGSVRQAAIKCFAEGKDPEFDLQRDLKRLRQAFRQRASLAQMFLEIQLSVAYADGELAASERELFRYLCQQLGINAMQFEWIHSRVRASRMGRGNSDQDLRRQLSNAYAVLGVEADASDAVLKKTYRKLMSEHHPDKLVAKGLPEQMIKLAKEKTQEIQTAYDLIKKARQASK